MSDIEAVALSGRRRDQRASSRPPTELDLRLGGRLRFLRIARGLSREEVANFLGLTPRDVREHERGSKRIRAKQLVQYAEFHGVRVSRLFADAGSPPHSIAGG